jgi:xanthine/CO dehydrogenase XdhC/CoxF family maturation factor
VGQSRITEFLARYLVQLDIDTTIVAPAIPETHYPSHARCHCQEETYHNVRFRADSITVIASHHAGDPELVQRALDAGSPYVAMIGSRKRAVDALETLGFTGAGRREVGAPFFAPAGLDLDARTPGEIAFSVVAEVLSLEAGTGPAVNLDRENALDGPG